MFDKIELYVLYYKGLLWLLLYSCLDLIILIEYFNYIII